jgi:hydrogenase-4 membrane subunit HyfE
MFILLVLECAMIALAIENKSNGRVNSAVLIFSGYAMFICLIHIINYPYAISLMKLDGSIVLIYFLFKTVAVFLTYMMKSKNTGHKLSENIEGLFIFYLITSLPFIIDYSIIRDLLFVIVPFPLPQ